MKWKWNKKKHEASIWQWMEGSQIIWNDIWINAVAGNRIELQFKYWRQMNETLCFIKRTWQVNGDVAWSKALGPIILPCRRIRVPIHVHIFTNTCRALKTRIERSKHISGNYFYHLHRVHHMLKNIFLSFQKQAHQHVHLSTYITNQGMAKHNSSRQDQIEQNKFHHQNFNPPYLTQ